MTAIEVVKGHPVISDQENWEQSCDWLENSRWHVRLEDTPIYCHTLSINQFGIYQELITIYPFDGYGISVTVSRQVPHWWFFHLLVANCSDGDILQAATVVGDIE